MPGGLRITTTANSASSILEARINGSEKGSDPRRLVWHKDATGSLGVCQQVWIVQIDRDGLVIGMVEKPRPEDAPSNLAIVGRYLLQPNCLSAWMRLRLP